MATHLDELLPNGFYCARYIFIQSRMSRLEDWGVIFLSPHEEVGGVYLSDVEDCVDGDFDFSSSGGSMGRVKHQKPDP